MSNPQRVFLSGVDRTDPRDLLMRLEPFLGIAHRTTAIFDILNNCLVSLHSTKNEPFGQNVLPVNYTFFKNEFRRFCEEACTDDEVATIIYETCKVLEALKWKRPPEGEIRADAFLNALVALMSPASCRRQRACREETVAAMVVAQGG